MQLRPIQVEWSAADSGEATPRRFVTDGQSIEVGEILDRWYQGPGNPEWPQADYFKVIGYDFREYLLKHDLEADRWFLVRPG